MNSSPTTTGTCQRRGIASRGPTRPASTMTASTVKSTSTSSRSIDDQRGLGGQDRQHQHAAAVPGAPAFTRCKKLQKLAKGSSARVSADVVCAQAEQFGVIAGHRPGLSEASAPSAALPADQLMSGPDVAS